MEALKKLIAFISQLTFTGKIISVIIITLTVILLTFFSSGCAFKFHADRLDNMTLENQIEKK